MPSIASPTSMERDVRITRVLSAALAVVIMLDVADIRAPGLAILAAPFVAAAIGLRRAGGLATTALLLWSCLYVAAGVNWIVADVGDGFGAGWGDMLFGYVGTPLAAALATVLVVHELHLRAARHQAHVLA